MRDACILPPYRMRRRQLVLTCNFQLPVGFQASSFRKEASQCKQFRRHGPQTWELHGEPQCDLYFGTEACCWCFICCFCSTDRRFLYCRLRPSIHVDVFLQ